MEHYTIIDLQDGEIYLYCVKCLTAKRPGNGGKKFGFTDVYRRVIKGDKFVFYVKGSGVISYKATVSENPAWRDEAEKIPFMTAHKEN